jgi:hypothetical protein
MPEGKDMYSVRNRGGSALTTSTELRAAALTEADKHCGAQGKKLDVIHSREISAGFAVFPEAEILFKCV